MLVATDKAIGELFQFLGDEILVGKLAAEERARFVAAGDLFHPLDRRQIQPLIVRGALVSVAQQRRAPDRLGGVEDHQQLVPVVGHLQLTNPQLPVGGIAAGIAQHHLQFDLHVAIA